MAPPNKKAQKIEETARKFKERLTKEEFFDLLLLGHLSVLSGAGLSWVEVKEVIKKGYG
jgi:hypothetical protein